LREALTHASANTTTNERLEFLGDRVLGLIVADLLLKRFPGDSEGLLAPRLNALVRIETCADVAKRAGIDAHIQMAPGEERSGGRQKTAIVGDACEAVIGALYCDGGLAAARRFIEKFWSPLLDQVAGDMRDPKTSLQEWAQARGLGTPSYLLAERTGPDHAPHFVVEVSISGAGRARGQGASRRVAEQEAARALMQTLDQAS
jgi:ribonuclease-3